MFKPILIFALFVFPASAEFRFELKNGQLSLYEDDQPLWVYHSEMVDPPEGVDEKFRRSSYFHPVYGLDGEVISQDFPSDHYHHRGIYWAWPETASDGRKMDIWTIKGAHQVFVKWLDQSAADSAAEFGVENVWLFDDDPEPKIREQVTVTTHASEKKTRALDFTLHFTNVSEKPFTFLGAKNKGYGGFNFRPHAKNKPMIFTTELGPQAEDTLNVQSPWADVSWVSKNTEKEAGVAIFQHASNPEYPHFGWLLRHYCFNGAAWPHETPYTLEPGNTLTLQYRLVIHRGSAKQAGIKKLFKHYENRASE
jgi:hypothetical protein